ncbi:hypothetical protein SASPL_116301 [Salvia splendens]|uniref:Aldehyde dehydrogenase domain-containing protein n=1 Tax=Salvia splendens TaxID=180675 RepID=A0A8X8ZXV1_SALSN|nr:hypothetical protein SASPL_116301 [Salvia splendens]
MMWISAVSASCKLALKELHRWMKPQKVKTSLISLPSSAKIVPEPFGVVLVISAWKFPFLLSLDPVVGAIAAGNVVVLKPSESSPAMSLLLAKLVGKYMDGSAVKVVEGAVAETTALLEQKWDKILRWQGGAYRAKCWGEASYTNDFGAWWEISSGSRKVEKIAARRIIGGKWCANSGQTCIAADYIITTKNFVPQLLNALSAQLDKFFGKEPLLSKELSSIVNIHHFNRLLKLLDDEEFLEAGLPFGGVGGSGMGACHGKFSFDAFSHKKALLKQSFALDISARYPPYTPGETAFSPCGCTRQSSSHYSVIIYLLVNFFHF